MVCDHMFRESGAANTMDYWKIRSERRLMQVTLLHCAADHSMGSGDLLLLVVEHDRSRQQDHDGYVR